MIPESTIREIADRADIVEVVGEYVSLKRSGSNWVGLCPFHSEKSPSFNVNPARGIFHCFGCGEGGNVFTFLMKIDSISFPDAVRRLGKRVGITVREEDETPEGRMRRQQADEGRRIMDLAASWFRRSLHTHATANVARDYLARRGVDDATSERYLLGYAPNERDALVRHLTTHRVSLQLAERLGIVRSGPGGFTDLFRNRIIFPIRNLTGEVVAFGGRILGEGTPKYLNSPESPLYRKSSILFGLHEAKRHAPDRNGIIVVEGYFDQLALWKEGFPTAVATCGTALTVDHVRLLRRFTRSLYLMFDGDEAGERAADRALQLIIGEGVTARWVVLPDGEDPDTFVSHHGADALRELMASAPELFDRFLDRLGRRYDLSTVDGRMCVVEGVAPLLSKVVDPLEQDLRVREVSRRLEIDPLILKRRLRNAGGGRLPIQDASGGAGSAGKGVDPELLLLALLERSPLLARRALGEGVANLVSQEISEAFVLVASTVQRGEPIDWDRVSETLPTDAARKALRIILMDEGLLGGTDGRERMYVDILKAVERQRLRRAKDLRAELARTDPASPRYREILLALEALRNVKSELS